MQIRADNITTTRAPGGLATAHPRAATEGPSLTAAGEKDLDGQVVLTLAAAGSLTLGWTAFMVWVVVRAAQWTLN